MLMAWKEAEQVICCTIYTSCRLQRPLLCGGLSKLKDAHELRCNQMQNLQLLVYWCVCNALIDAEMVSGHFSVLGQLERRFSRPTSKQIESYSGGVLCELQNSICADMRYC